MLLELLSSLVNSFDAYDDLQLIKIINQTVTNFLDLMKGTKEGPYTYNVYPDNPLPRWLVPIVNNPLKLYTNGDNETYDKLIELYDNTISSNTDYYQESIPY